MPDNAPDKALGIGASPVSPDGNVYVGSLGLQCDCVSAIKNAFLPIADPSPCSACATACLKDNPRVTLVAAVVSNAECLAGSATWVYIIKGKLTRVARKCFDPHPAFAIAYIIATRVRNCVRMRPVRHTEHNLFIATAVNRRAAKRCPADIAARGGTVGAPVQSKLSVPKSCYRRAASPVHEWMCAGLQQIEVASVDAQISIFNVRTFDSPLGE